MDKKVQPVVNLLDLHEMIALEAAVDDSDPHSHAVLEGQSMVGVTLLCLLHPMTPGNFLAI